MHRHRYRWRSAAARFGLRPGSGRVHAMTTRWPVVVAVTCLTTAGVAWTSGCGDEGPAYCASHPEDTEVCPAPDAGLCMTDDDCAGQVCDTASGACVQCTTDKAAACTGMAPVCGD